MTWAWVWSWSTPPTHAHFGDNPVADWLRVLCVLAGVILALWIGRVLVEQRRRAERFPVGQVCRFVSLMLADVSLSFTEVVMVGTPATPRLFVNISCLVIGAVGVRSMRRKQCGQLILEGK